MLILHHSVGKKKQKTKDPEQKLHMLNDSILRMTLSVK